MAGQRLDRRHQGLTVAAVLAIAACTPPPPPPPGAIPLDVVMAGRELAGRWSWMHFDVLGGAMVREREEWRFMSTDDARRLTGFVRRDVLVRSLDGVPFECNQRLRYHQRATFAVTAEVTAGGILITERDYEAAPSPCDPGLRQLGDYLASFERGRLVMRWHDGEATLIRADDSDLPRFAAPPLAPPAPAGRWRWQMTSWTKAGLVRSEDEDWELAATPDGELAGTYVRVVSVRSPDNTPLPCAGAPAYGFVDRYLVRGKRDDDGWRIDEVTAAPGNHPCLADTPARTLDGATAAADGDYLVLQWRGKRRQVLARPAAN